MIQRRSVNSATPEWHLRLVVHCRSIDLGDGGFGLSNMVHFSPVFRACLGVAASDYRRGASGLVAGPWPGCAPA